VFFVAKNGLEIFVPIGHFKRCFRLLGLSNGQSAALFGGMSTLTLTVKKPARPFQRRVKRQREPRKYVFGLGWRKITPVHTGIKDLSEREGLDA